MIREATAADIPRMAAMGKRMWEESRYYSKFDLDWSKIVAFFEQHISNPMGIALISENGVLLASVTSVWFSQGLIGEDSMIYVEPEHRGGTQGIRLIQRYISEAKKRGAAEIHIGNAAGIVDHQRLTQIYERLGFQQIGSYCCQEVPDGLSE